MSRIADLERFYELLGLLEERAGARRTLAKLGNDCPHRGVYFFYEPAEVREHSGRGARVVRVGTHALSSGSGSTLRERLAQHRGQKSGGGKHRHSIFRLLIGQALLERGDIAPCASWGVKPNSRKATEATITDPQSVSRLEEPVEQSVSRYIATMPFLLLDVGDEPGRDSKRGYIERNALALLSNFARESVDPPTRGWLGHSSSRPLVRGSGLWNQRHVEETHDPAFLGVFEMLITRMGSGVDRVQRR